MARELAGPEGDREDPTPDARDPVDPVSEEELDSAGPGKPLPRLSESADLGRRARAGDLQALQQLLERYRERLERIVRVELGSELGRHFDPGDIVQEVFLVVQRRIQEPDGEGVREAFELRSHAALLAYLVTVAKRKVKDWRAHMNAGKRDIGRNQSMQGTRLGRSGSSFGRQIAHDTSGPATRAYKNEIRELMDECMARLPEDYRQVILKRDYYGADWDELEQELGRTKHACQELHRRAWIRLKLDVMRRLRGPE